MSLRGWSKDRNRKVTPPGPVYMSNDQFASYLSDLRSNRVTRPSGARPPPPSTRRNSVRNSVQPPPQPEVRVPESPAVDPTIRSASSMSHKRASASISTYSSATSRHGRQLAQPPSAIPPEPKVLKASDVVPTANYLERGQRWMEKEEAVSLREAMEDLDLKKAEEKAAEEARIHAAAQNEASELVFKHQNPKPEPSPDAPYRYNDHLRKNSYQHARTQSVGPYSGGAIVTGLARDIPKRSASGASNSSGGIQSPRSPVEHDPFSEAFASDGKGRRSMDSTKTSSKSDRKSYGNVSSSSKGFGSSVRKSSAKRNVSGEVASIFTGEQIWEEPEQESPERGRPEARDVPAPLRLKPRNPLNRVQFAAEPTPRSNSTPPEPTKKISITEIHRNPPTRSRNPFYTANSAPTVQVPSPEKPAEEAAPPVPMKDGLEIRGDDIRQATSMKLKDRSPKLPVPTAVSDKPGRPIVSFDANWKPKEEADSKPEVRRKSPFDRSPFNRSPFNRDSTGSKRESLFGRSDSKAVSASVTPVLVSSSPTAEVKNGEREILFGRSDSKSVSATVPTVLVPSSPSVEVKQDKTRPLSRINSLQPEIPRSPSIEAKRKHVRPLPTPVHKDSVPVDVRRNDIRPLPSIDVLHSAPAVPTINFPDSGPSIPTINLPDEQPKIPTINVPDSKPKIPTINFPDSPSIPASAPGIPTINVASDSPTGQSKRPLPNPKTAAGRSTRAYQPGTRGHWSPAGPVGTRATASCHQCQLPIEGRVVKLSGAAEHFHPQCFICFTCGTGLESLEIHPEPRAKRAERLDRIKRRAQGEGVPEIEGQTYAEDGDERLRYFCHLDYHEIYAPKCKHCKTPIIGEHMVALGENWHYGHFFCAECGDPFEKGMTHIEKDGYAWCLNCQTKRTARAAPKCKKCKNPVIGEYVQALGGEWHDNCFRCASCNDGFVDGAFYPKQVGTATIVLCIGCAERELKA